MAHNFLKLTQDKTEVMEMRGLGDKIKIKFLYLLKPGLYTSQVKNLDILFDISLDFYAHIRNVTTASCHLRNIAKVRPFLSNKDY